ncbi:MAG: pseudoazurin [Sinorhizobium meliloti]|uniref:pseudoazurin n=1 Tax=Sinorhizobium TaxID=28105 RepID=UPI00036DB088|nr:MULTISPECIES: pseudoazurin [Sinorhizobium]MCG5483577.1 pseudoazurin [Sinorhizobium meliloti]PND22955.1 pseudoazurin [Ensifer sp. MMN_5]PND25708.1 pseudoazurin [Sinorhizobium sp. M4_45]RVQ03539.1 pseudoazurin [Sinorhizobium meliloti]
MHRLAQVALIMLATIAVPPVSQAADHEVKMVNYGAEGSMVFEPGFLEVEVGDTVTFVPTNSGHNVRSYAVPEGVETWNTPLDERATVKIERPGVYVYYCPPHLMMSMIGVIKAGEPANLAAVLQKAGKLRSKLVMEGERLDNYLRQVK